MGDDAAMLSVVNSANIACGGHASDPDTMYETLVMAKENNVTIGAHPGYNDRAGFGRRVIPMSPEQIGCMVAAQIGALQGVAHLAGTRVAYVKPHGALGNLAAANVEVAAAIVAAIQAIDKNLAVLAISGMQLEVAARDAGAPVYSEIFADRGYLSSGHLMPRGTEGAMIHDADAAADRLLAVLETGKMPVVDGPPITLAADSICVHGDGPSAVAMAKAIRARLTAAGVALQSFC